jgi:hypothetical protein
VGDYSWRESLRAWRQVGSFGLWQEYQVKLISKLKRKRLRTPNRNLVTVRVCPLTEARKRRFVQDREYPHEVLLGQMRIPQESNRKVANLRYWQRHSAYFPACARRDQKSGALFLWAFRTWLRQDAKMSRRFARLSSSRILLRGISQWLPPSLLLCKRLRRTSRQDAKMSRTWSAEPPGRLEIQVLSVFILD